MPVPIRIALVGDYDAGVVAHQAIPAALTLAAAALRQSVEPHWVPTDQVRDPQELATFDGLWCVPASPYRNIEGALMAIRFAREAPRPFLGTCAGFQHALIEYARSVLGWANAEHAETTPDAARPVIASLACSLLEVSNTLHFAEHSRLARVYGRLEASEGYHCSYGLNPIFAQELTSGPLRPVAWDDSEEIRAVELDGHPFFVATLFQPERSALRGELPPLVHAFVHAALSSRDAQIRH